MATKTEFKAYLTTLKGVAKNTPRGVAKRGVSIVDNTINTTNGNLVATLKVGIGATGVYDIRSLDVVEMDITASLQAWKKDDETFAEPAMVVEDTRVVDKINTAALVKALEYVSNDDYHAILKKVFVENGLMTATDGYKAYLNEVDLPNTRLSAAMLTAFKRLSKHGVWRIATGVGEKGQPLVRIYNEYFSLTEVVSDSEVEYPNMKKVLKDKHEEFTTVLTIPLKEVLRFSDKDHLALRVNEDMSISLGGNSDFLPTPLTASIQEVCGRTLTDIPMAWQVLCPFAKEEGEIVAFNAKLAKPLMDKNGNLVLYFNKKTRSFLVQK